MNLLNQKQFATWAGVSENAVSKALKPNDGRLERYPGTKKIDADSIKSRQFRESTSHQRSQHKLNNLTNPVTILPPSDNAPTIPDNIEDIGNNVEKYTKYRAEKEKQGAKNLKLKNLHLDGILVEKETILTGALMYFDQLHSDMDRFFGTILDNLAPKILAVGDCTPEIIQEAIDEGKLIIHEGKVEFLSRVKNIIEDIKK